MKTKILANFRICISVPLKVKNQIIWQTFERSPEVRKDFVSDSQLNMR